MKATKIAIIGTGAVGATTAYACMMRNIASEIMLVDINEISCRGELLDLSDALSMSSTARISQVTYKQAAQADIIIIAAGKAQKKGHPRSDLLDTNQKVIACIVQELGDINPQAIIIVITNPVDILTRYAQKLINLPRTQIFGSGTMLDSQRLRNLIAQKIKVSERSIHAYIIGQHGDEQVAALSAGNIAGVPLDTFISMHELLAMAEATKNKVYEIIDCKGCTCYGVATCVAAICEDIIFDQNRVVPVSCFIEQYDTCMSMPAVIGATGIQKIIHPPLNSHEQKLLDQSIESLAAGFKKLPQGPK